MLSDPPPRPLPRSFASLATMSERSVYTRPAACDRRGAAGVFLMALSALLAVTWQWGHPIAMSSARPAPALSTFDVAPASLHQAPPRPTVQPQPRQPATSAPMAIVTPPVPVVRLVPAAHPPAVSPALSPPGTVTVAANPPAPPPATAAPVAAHPVAATSPASERSARANWQGDLLAHLKPLLRYPRMAQGAGQQGVTLVAVTVERSGAVRSVRIARGSGYPVLDQEAVATIKRGAPLPPPTADIPGDPVAVDLPIQFSLRG